MRAALSLAAVLALAGCYEDPPEFTPGSFVDKLRILDIRANPPDVAPGDQTLLSSLVVDPYESVRSLSFVWILCDPDPTGNGASPCARQDTVRDLAALAAQRAELPPGIHIVPIGDSAYYRAPADTFDNFPPGSRERENGVAATVLLVAFEGTDFQTLADPDTVKAVALKRLRVAPRSVPRNHNPEILSVSVDGQRLADDAVPTFPAGTVVHLSAAPTDASRETFDRTLPDGTVSHETEPAVFSWYSNAGRFDELQPQSARTSGTDPIDFRVPKFEDTVDGVITLWVVLRDARGGADWVQRKLYVAP